METLNIEQLRTKYQNIEDKIGIDKQWKTYDEAEIALAQDICFEWNIQDNELIRVISLVSMYSKVRLNLGKHIDQMFAFAGLYPHIMKTFDILPDTIPGIEHKPEYLAYLCDQRAKLKNNTNV